MSYLEDLESALPLSWASNGRGYESCKPGWVVKISPGSVEFDEPFFAITPGVTDQSGEKAAKAIIGRIVERLPEFEDAMPERAEFIRSAQAKLKGTS